MTHKPQTSKKTSQSFEVTLLQRARELGIAIPPERLGDIINGAHQLEGSRQRIADYLRNSSLTE